MINRLYTVSTTVTAVVMATSELEAQQRFKADLREIIGDQPVDAVSEHEIRRELDIPDDWSVDCLPYGQSGDEITIGQFLDVLPPPVVRDSKTIDMFAATTSGGVK